MLGNYDHIICILSVWYQSIPQLHKFIDYFFGLPPKPKLNFNNTLRVIINTFIALSILSIVVKLALLTITIVNNILRVVIIDNILRELIVGNILSIVFKAILIKRLFGNINLKYYLKQK